MHVTINTHQVEIKNWLDLPRHFRIYTPKAYEQLKQRIDKGHQFLLENKEDDPYIHELEHIFEAMCIACLEWEINHNLLPV